MFSDVSPDLNTYDAIRDLKDEGWVVGVGDNEYKPFDTVTRAQLAVFIGRAAFGVHYQPTGSAGMFPDVPSDYWGAGWIEAVVDAGLMDGYADGRFYPRNPATRADVAVLVHVLTR